MQLSFSVWVTTACNLRCRYCYEGIEKEKLFLDQNKALDIIRYIKDNADKRKADKINIEFHGGEPLLNFPAVRFFINSASEILAEYELSYQLTTNGTVLDDEMLDLLKEKVRHLTVSIDGDKYTHDMFRVDANENGTYDTVIRNSLKLLDAYGSSLRVRMTFNPATVDKLYDNIAHLAGMGFRIIIAHPDLFDKNWNDEKIKVLGSEIAKLRELQIDEGTYINLREPVMLMKKGICSIGSDGDNIYPDGKIYGCTMAAGIPEYNIGSIDTGTDSDRIRSILSHSCERMEKCSGCSFTPFCDSSRCRIINKLVNDDYCDPIGIQCALNNILIKYNGFVKPKVLT